MAIFLILSCSGDDDGGGFVPAPDGSTPTPEDSTQTTFTMTEYFPLSSGWVTDHYTLFIDADDHQVTSGEVAKAMVDTRLPSIMYWTNDDRGLLLHELTDLSENKLTFTSTPPIKFADATCKVGDKQEGTVTIKADGEPEETLNYIIEVLGVEEVTTPAGTFSGCLKLQLKAWGPDVLPDLVPAEFLWFAQNVGFVKAQHENLTAGADTDEAGLELFADVGEMRQLISYHITPEPEAPEVEAIKDNEALFQKALENEDVDATMALTDDQYYDRCRDKQQWRGAMTSWFETITDFKNYQTGVDTLFNAAGDEAAKFRESLQTSQSNDLSELNKEWNFKTRRYNKSGGEWLYLGSPIEVTPESAGGWAMVYVRKLPDNIGLAMSVGLGDCSTGQRISTPDRIKSLKVTGPPGSLITDYDLKADWDSTYEEFYNQFDLSNDINNIASGLYTFELVDQRDNVYEFSRYMGRPIELPIPVQRAPDLSNPSGVNFLWDPIVNDPEISFYRVEVFDSDTESRVVNINTTNNSQFVEFGNGQNQIPPGGNYTWRVRARYFDMYGYTLSESRCNLIPLVLD
jgi:hypothetical protein